MMPIVDKEQPQTLEKPFPIQGLEMIGRIADVALKTQELVYDWVLLTFDLPTTKEGNAARYEFYKAARRAGMTAHTESVYFGPACPEAQAAIFEVASKGNAFIWWSRVPEREAALLTKTYDAALVKRFAEVEARLTKVSLMLEEEKTRLGLARKILDGTNQMVETLNQAATWRASQSLMDRAQALREWFDLLSRILPERKIQTRKPPRVRMLVANGPDPSRPTH